MATVFRGPLEVSRREVAPVLHLKAVIVVGSLLTTVLAPGPTPQPLKQANRSLPLQVQHRPMVLNADTSHGSFKPALAELVLPRGKSVLSSAPDVKRIYDDSSFYRPLSLDVVAPVQSPFSNPWTAAPALWRTTPDTSYGPANVFLPELVTPLGQSVLQSAPASQRIGVDTSQDSQVALFGSVVTQSPFLNVYLDAPSMRRNNPDTSQDMTTPVILAGTFPIGAQAFAAPLRFSFQPADSTQEVPKTMLPELVLPVGTVAPAFAPLLARTVVDTSQPQPVTLFPVSLPPGAQSFTWLARFGHLISDTSASKPVALVAVSPPLPTGTVSAWCETPYPNRSVTDSSTGTPVPLFPQVFPSAGITTDPYHQLGRVHFGPSGIRRR